MELTTTISETEPTTTTATTTAKSASERKELLARSVQSHVAQATGSSRQPATTAPCLSKGTSPTI